MLEIMKTKKGLIGYRRFYDSFCILISYKKAFRNISTNHSVESKFLSI